MWVNCPYRLLGRVWRKLRNDGTTTTVLVPLWQSSTWWGLMAPDGVYFSMEVIDWVWHPRGSTTFLFQVQVPAVRTLSRPNS